MLNQNQKILNSSPYACVWHRIESNEDGFLSHFVCEGFNCAFRDQFSQLPVNEISNSSKATKDTFLWYLHLENLWKSNQPKTFEHYFSSVGKFIKVDSSILDDGLIVSWISVLASKTDSTPNYENSIISLLLEQLEGIAVQGYGADRKVKFWNKSSEEMYGYTASEAYGKDITDLIIPEEMRISVINNIEQMLKTSEARSPEFLELKDKNGNLVQVMSHHTVLEYPKGEYLLFCTDVDMSAWNEADEKIRKLSRVVEQSPVSIIITDNEGYIEYVNPFFCELTGFNKEEVLGNNPLFQKSDLLPKEQSTDLWNTISKGKIWRGELINRKKNGEIYFELATVSPIVNSKGEITHFACVKQDITESKKIEQELLEAREKARESDLLKAAFLQNMSHEIRTPMNAILGFSELARSKDLTFEKRDEYLAIVIKSTHRLLGIVEDIMDVSRLETGDIVLKNRSVRLSALMEKLYHSYKKKIEGDVELLLPIVDFSLQKNNVQVDSERLMQVLDKLLSNAVKFTPKGQIKFGCYRHNDCIRFFVEDTGIGIDSEMISHIFQPFYQLDMGQTRAFGGNGLGLTIASRIIEKMGSSIQVESVHHQGSCFFFDLVFGKNEMQEEAPMQHIIPEKEKFTILVAENDDISFILFREILIKKFDQNKLEVLRASNENQTIEFCRKRGSIDLIFVDYKMSGLNGGSIATQVKTICPTTPVVGLFEGSSDVTGDEMLNAGCDDYLSKPFNQDFLIEKVSRFLRISN